MVIRLVENINEERKTFKNINANTDYRLKKNRNREIHNLKRKKIRGCGDGAIVPLSQRDFF